MKFKELIEKTLIEDCACRTKNALLAMMKDRLDEIHYRIAGRWSSTKYPELIKEYETISYAMRNLDQMSPKDFLATEIDSVYDSVANGSVAASSKIYKAILDRRST